MSLPDDLTLAMRSAPEAFKDPTLAVSAATAGGDVQQNTEVTAHLLNAQAQQNAVNTVATHHGGHGLLGATLSWLGGGIKSATDLVGTGIQDIGHIANMGLSDVQHQYRYLRDVESQHGFAAMLGVSLPMVVGGLIGGAVTGGAGAFAGATLGAELFGAVTDRNAYKDSWDRTNSATYVDPHGGGPVSPGRDVARLLGSLTEHVGIHIEQHAGFDLYDAVSAAGDGLFDLATDPLMKAAALRGAAVGEEGLKGALATRWGGTAMKEANVVKVAEQYPSVRKALTTMAGISDAGEVAAKFPKFKAFATQIAGADTYEKVGQVFVDNAAAAQMVGRTLPRATVGKVLFGPASEALRNAASEAALGDSKALRTLGENYKRATTLVPTSYNKVTDAISRNTLYFSDPGSAGTILNIARWGHTEEMARAVATQWALGTEPERMAIFRNVMTDNIANRMEAVQAGWTQTAEGSETIARIGDGIDHVFGGIDAGKTTPWGFDEEGRIISKHELKGQTVSTPILEGQHYNVPMPDYMEFDRNLKSLGNGSAMYGKADDFLYRHFTQGVFKKWVLASGGFALRVSTGELLPQIAADAKGLYRGKVGEIMADHGWKLVPGEDEHILAPIARFMAKRTSLTDEEIGVLADSIKMNGGESVASAVSSGHGQGQEIIGTEEYVKDSIYSLKKDVPKSVRVTDDVSAWGPEHDDHWVFHQKQAEDLAQSPATRAAAKAYADAMAGATTPAEQVLRKPEATHRATLAAKKALDETPEEILKRNQRHFYASNVDERLPGKIDVAPRHWIAGTKEVPGHWEYTGQRTLVGRDVMQQSLLPGQEVAETRWVRGDPETPGSFQETGRDLPIGQQTVQPTLVNPKGNTPGGMRAGATYGEINGPPGATFREEKWVPGRKGTEGHYEATGRTHVVGEATGQQSLLPGTEVAESRYVRGTPGTPATVEAGARDIQDVELQAQRLDLPELAPDPHQEWARVITENLKGTIHGQDGMLHDEILNAIAEGRAPTTEYMQDIPMESRPAKIMGAYEKPPAPDRFTDRIFNRLNGVINWMSREPIYNAEMLRQWKDFKPLVDEGILTRDEALQRMSTRSVNNVLPQIHNINERSLMSEHMHNFVPFYFAQQQSYARLFRLLETNPMAFRKVQLAYSNLADFGGVYDDSSGNKHFVVPGLGFLTSASMKGLSSLGIPVIGSLPTAFSGNLKSLASLSPFLEGSELIRPGPLVALGARAIQNILPEAMGLKQGFTDISTDVLGSQTQQQSMWDMLVPNATVRNVVSVFTKSDNRTQMKSVLDAVQSLEYQQNVAMTKWQQAGGKGEAPQIVPSATATDMQRQHFIDRVKNTARILTVSKAIIGAFSPVAPSVQLGDYKLKTELYDAIKKDGISKAINDFLIKNPDATPYTVFETDTGVASPIESTHPAQQWVKNNLDFINSDKYGAAASYFVPQTNDPFNQTVYNEQMAMGLRFVKAPDQLIKDIHTAEGNRWYFDVYKKAKDAELAKATSPHDRQAVNHQFATAGSKDGTVQSLESMKLTNPIWYTNFSSGGRGNERNIALQQMRDALTNNAAPDSPMTAGLTALLQDYDKHSAALLPGRTDSYAAAQRTTEKAQWQSYLKTLGTDHPELAMVINNIFRGV